MRADRLLVLIFFILAIRLIRDKYDAQRYATIFCRIKSLTLKLSAPTLTTAQIFVEINSSRCFLSQQTYEAILIFQNNLASAYAPSTTRETIPPLSKTHYEVSQSLSVRPPEPLSSCIPQGTHPPA